MNNRPKKPDYKLKACDEIEAESIFRRAIAHLVTATKLKHMYNMEEHDSTFHSYIQNKAFAVELFLKSYSGLTSKRYYKEHNLKIIFYNMDEFWQNRLRYFMPAPGFSHVFEELLDENSNVYRDSRYDFNHEHLNSWNDPDFLINLILEAIYAERPIWKKHEKVHWDLKRNMGLVR